jgi:tryptophanase
MKEVGCPIIEPTGGHAVFVDAGRLLPHISPNQFPGQGLAIALYVKGGIRTAEIGSLMFGAVDPGSGKFVPASKELLRMALPRRVYTNSHLDYVAEVAGLVVQRKDQIPGYVISRETEFLRHFSCDLAVAAPVPSHS